jgi:hypothetical protein
MTKIQELNQWIVNYEQIKVELQAAFRFKNQRAVDDLSKRLLNTESMIARLVVDLKKNGNGKPYGAVSASVNTGVDIPEHAALHTKLGSPVGDK